MHPQWLFLSLMLIFAGCKVDSERFQLSKEIRTKFKAQLKPAKKPDYKKIYGAIPSDDELELGRLLFSDPILSRNNDVSCATCHLTNHGFADGNALSVGSLGRGGPHGFNVGKTFGTGVLSLERSLGSDGMGYDGERFMFRNAPSTMNVIYRANFRSNLGLFWDGRFGRLDFQVLLPIHTHEEMCGINPLPIKNNPFVKGGPIFGDMNILVRNSFLVNNRTGADLDFPFAPATEFSGIESFRKTGVRTYPNRNECMAIAIAKLRGVPYYREMFKKIYNRPVITDREIALALSSYIATHVAIDSPYDQFVAGDDSLSVEQLKGLAIFMSPAGEKFKLGKEEHTGAGCINCHSPPMFGGDSFYALGVISDRRSILSRADNGVGKSKSGFFRRTRHGKRGELNCHVNGKTSTPEYAPDVGLAGGTFRDKDCFKFRTPTLRNVIETYPYFHHGSARGQGVVAKTLEEKALAGLEQVVDYHLAGPTHVEYFERLNYGQVYDDKTLQRDRLVSYFYLDFKNDKRENKDIFPIKLKKTDKKALINFVAYGLWDKDAVKKGALGNEISHPKTVPSGFTPSITRDEGNQLEVPPTTDLLK